jgi:hypothetical protein
MTDKIIMWDSDEAAKFVTVKGWLSSKGHFYNDEDIARYDGCTHKVCGCGNTMDKHRVICTDCEENRKIEIYNNLPRKIWDCEECVYSLKHDKWFVFEDDIFLFLDNDIELEEFLNLSSLSELQLIFGVPDYAHSIDPYNMYADIMPEDEDELPQEIIDAFNELNDTLQAYKTPLSYHYPPLRFAEAVDVTELDKEFIKLQELARKEQANG